jgi:polar amino acid transport system permease protein
VIEEERMADTAADRRVEQSPPTSGKVDVAAIRVVHTKHWWRWTISAVVVFILAQFVWSLFTNEQYDWDTFGKYFFSDPVIKGVGITLFLTVISALIGFVLGTILAIARISKSLLLSGAAWLYIWFFRSVPLIVQIIVWFNLGYLYPTLGLGTPFTYDYWIVEFPTVQLISAFAAAILGLGLHQAAYSAEVIRGGLLSVDQGQLEAAAALGLPTHKRLFRIVLPQAMPSIIPNATNEIINLVKSAAVVFVIALPELFYAVQVIYNRNSRVIPLLLVAVVWYTIITTILSIAQYYIERHYAKGTVRILPPTPLQRVRHWFAVQWARLGDAPSPPVLSGADAPPVGVTSRRHDDSGFGGVNG